MCKISEIKDTDFSLIVENSSYLYEIAQKCGYKTNSNIKPVLRNKIKERIQQLGLDITHFKYNEPKPLKDWLTIWETKHRLPYLKKRIINEGLLKEECILCGQKNIWNGKKLVLHLDHINGNNQDNRIENLRILCPNCHTQTETYCRSKICESML